MPITKNSTTRAGDHAIHQVFRGLSDKDDSLTKAMIGEQLGNIDIAMSYNSTFLHHAAKVNRINALRLCIEMGADLNRQEQPHILLGDGTKENTPLIWAIANSSIDAALLLIESGADINIVSGFGNEPDPDDPSLEVFGGNTALTLAIGKGYTHTNVSADPGSAAPPIGLVIDTLIEKGADVNHQTYDGYSPLHLAALHRDTELVDKLISQGADLKAKDRNGRTAMNLLELSHKEAHKILEDNTYVCTMIPEKEWATRKARIKANLIKAQSVSAAKER